jgi:YHS domain-containing protein
MRTLTFTHYSRAAATFCAALALAAGLAWAKQPVDPVFTSASAAVRGYDVVAYFDQGQPVKGRKEFAHTWMGASWRFSSEENRDRFAADPARYAPQYGGYCAYAVSEGYTAPTDPDAFQIRNGKLYLNYSKKVQELWLEDADRRIAQADRNWPSLHR